MKSLADLKRMIKPGVRLRCIENTYRPELSGRERVIVRVQTNAFTWRHDPPTVHTLTGTQCSCGWTAPTYPGSNIEKEFVGHCKNAARESWTRYEKASLFRFDGSNTFEMRLFDMNPNSEKYVRLEVL